MGGCAWVRSRPPRDSLTPTNSRSSLLDARYNAAT